MIKTISSHKNKEIYVVSNNGGVKCIILHYIGFHIWPTLNSSDNYHEFLREARCICNILLLQKVKPSIPSMSWWRQNYILEVFWCQTLFTLKCLQYRAEIYRWLIHRNALICKFKVNYVIYLITLASLHIVFIPMTYMMTIANNSFGA